MEELTPELITKIISNATKRPRYIESVLEFVLGREPTQAEIDQVNNDNNLRTVAYAKWLSRQPWHIRKRVVPTEERIRTILIKRYSVPDSLISMYTYEIEKQYRDW